MTINNIRLALFCFSLILLQFTLNNLTIFYVDLLAIVLVSLLLIGGYSWLQLISLCLVADLIGHWYLGCHLLAVTLLSLFSGGFVNFYRMCNWFQRTMISSVFFLLLVLIIYLVQLMAGKNFSSPFSLVLEIFILLPVVQLLLHLVVIRNSADFFYND